MGKVVDVNRNAETVLRIEYDEYEGRDFVRMQWYKKDQQSGEWRRLCRKQKCGQWHAQLLTFPPNMGDKIANAIMQVVGKAEPSEEELPF